MVEHSHRPIVYSSNILWCRLYQCTNEHKKDSILYSNLFRQQVLAKNRGLPQNAAAVMTRSEAVLVCRAVVQPTVVKFYTARLLISFEG